MRRPRWRWLGSLAARNRTASRWWRWCWWWCCEHAVILAAGRIVFGGASAALVAMDGMLADHFGV